MRKHFMVLLIIFITGLFINTVNNGSLKACGTKTAACKTMLKKEIKTEGTDRIEENDPSLFLLVNPLIH